MFGLLQSVREEEAHAGGPKKKKPKQEVAASTYVEGRKRRINPPHVNYTVRETDTFQDLNLIKRHIPRSQLESILYDVYASGNDALIYYEKQFDIGQVCGAHRWVWSLSVLSDKMWRCVCMCVFVCVCIRLFV